MKVSIKIDEDVKAELVKYAGKLQSQKGVQVTISDAIKELLTNSIKTPTEA